MDGLEVKMAELLEKGLAKTREEAEAKAKEIIANEVKTLQKENADLKSKVEENEKEVKAVSVRLDEKTKEIEAILTEANRVRAEERQKQVKPMADVIGDTLKENEATLKNWSGEGKGNHAFQMKAVGTIGVPSGGVAPEFAPWVGIAHEMSHARSVIPVSPTQSDVIKYIKYSDKEGAINTVAAGGAKPQKDFTPSVQSATVYKLAGHVTVTDEFLDDVVGSRDFLSQELPLALLDVEDTKLFKGSGSNDIAGIYTGATDITFPFGSVLSNSNKWDKLAAAAATVRLSKRGATAIFLSPQDYMELLINKTTAGEYTYPQMLNGDALKIGDVPVYQHTVFAAGEALIGDFARGARIFQKMAPVIKFSTEHASNFTSNLTTVVIEERLALPVYYTFYKINLATVAP